MLDFNQLRIPQILFLPPLPTVKALSVLELWSLTIVRVTGFVSYVIGQSLMKLVNYLSSVIQKVDMFAQYDVGFLIYKECKYMQMFYYFLLPESLNKFETVSVS